MMTRPRSVARQPIQFGVVVALVVVVALEQRSWSCQVQPPIVVGWAGREPHR